jgi:hypothetical protein
LEAIARNLWNTGASPPYRHHGVTFCHFTKRGPDCPHRVWIECKAGGDRQRNEGFPSRWLEVQVHVSSRDENLAVVRELSCPDLGQRYVERQLSERRRARFVRSAEGPAVSKLGFAKGSQFSDNCHV